MERSILAIDLKSFYASVECIERGLDPLKTFLVVADPTRNGAITLAITPPMKALGLPSRCRIYEIPKGLKYIKAKPRMGLYASKSKEIISIFLDFVSYKDLHVYSIDESFLDVTSYLKYYNMSDVQLAKLIMKTIKDKTGLTSTCGIGSNMFLAKVAMDIESKHSKDNIAKWTIKDVPSKLWPISPLDKVWGIGKQTMKKLNNLGIYKVGDINKYTITFYKKRFGILGCELYNHANGIDEAIISENNYKPKSTSYSLSQILYRDYNLLDTTLIIKEMVDTLTRRLRLNNKYTSVVALGISYSKGIGGGFYHFRKLDKDTDEENIIYSSLLYIFNTYAEDLPIRKVSISFGKISNNNYIQFSLFENANKTLENIKLNKAVDTIKDKYGKNAILYSTSLLNSSTIKRRNNTLGGHSL